MQAFTCLPKIQISSGDLSHVWLFYNLIPKEREKKSDFSPELSFTVVHDISPSFHRQLIKKSMNLSSHKPRLHVVLFGVHCPPSPHVIHLAQWIHSPCEQLCEVFILGLVSAYLKDNTYLTCFQLKEHFSLSFQSFGVCTLCGKYAIWLAITSYNR